MQINKMSFKTNIDTDVAADEVKSALKADRRIWSFDFDKDNEDKILHVSAEIESAEIVAKINALGFIAMPIN